MDSQYKAPIVRVFHLYITQMEDLPENIEAMDLPRQYDKWKEWDFEQVPLPPEYHQVVRFEVVGNMGSEQAALMLCGKAFRMGWEVHNTLSFMTQSYQPAFKGGEE